MCKKLSEAVEKMVAEDTDDSPSLKEKRDAMNDLMRATQANARDKEAKLQENLRQVRMVFWF